MRKTDRSDARTPLGRASLATRGAGGHMLEAGGLWTKAGIDRGR